MKTASMLQNSVRGLGSLMLVLGLLVWTENFDILVPIHILLGLLLVITLLALAYVAARASVPLGPVILVVAWTLVMLVIGLTQENTFPDPSTFHWVIQVVHLLIGVGAIGMGEMLRSRMKKTGTASASA
jgi:hypothetical protein